ncbi:type 4a pilus biogenesis protein PilO [Candidatus Parcubacteria bacterium]|nr:type 4a pilus biogenesis protein PilO [Candidatus Parcubacteria bacterium]
MSVSYRQLIGLLLLAVAVLVAWLVVWPMWNNFQASQTLLADARVHLADKEALLERISRLQREFESNRAQAERVNLVIPIGRDIPGVLETVNALATVSGISLDVFSLDAGGGQGTTIEGTTLAMLPISVGVSGSYDAVKTFLRNVEQNIRLFETTSMSFIKREGTDAGPGTFTLTAQVSAYYQ